MIWIAEANQIYSGILGADTMRTCCLPYLRNSLFILLGVLIMVSWASVGAASGDHRSDAAQTTQQISPAVIRAEAAAINAGI